MKNENIRQAFKKLSPYYDNLMFVEPTIKPEAYRFFEHGYNSRNEEVQEYQELRELQTRNFTELLGKYTQLQQTIESMTSCLTEKMTVFKDYSRMHRHKHTVEGNKKAVTNQNHADDIRDCLFNIALKDTLIRIKE
jgi:hypothetical protein